MVLRNTRKENSVFDEMKVRLYSKRRLERKYAYELYTGDELIDILETIDDDYTFNLFKLDEIISLEYNSEEVQRKFYSQKLYIENLNISESSKIDSILTTACTLNNFSNLCLHLNEHEFYFLTICLLNTDYKNFDKFKEKIDLFLNVNNLNETAKTYTKK